MEDKSPLKILYGVQATGQGHITRARVLGPALQKEGAVVDFLFSGRPREELYSMEPFGDFQARRGLTFYFNHGQVSPLKTFTKNNCFELLRDIQNLNLQTYDLVITDYEPVTSWAAKIRGIPSIGIGHQYAFKHDILKTGFNKASLAGMNWLAPAEQTFGIHWHHFDQPIIPPMFDHPDANKEIDPKKIVVYLNFEELADVMHLVWGFKDYDFYLYSSQVKEPSDLGHIKLRPTSNRFKSDIETCVGIICGAGFELPTEAMHMGKKILVKAMDGQPEQLSNALAIQNLGIGRAMNTLDPAIVKDWLNAPQANRVIYPDTATAFAKWVVHDQWTRPQKLIADLWRDAKGLENLRL